MTVTTVTTSTTSTYTITNGNELLVANGGNVTGPTIDAGGTLQISGGIESNAIVSSGGIETMTAGSASGDQIYGTLSAFSGGTGHLSNEIVEAGGKFFEYNSITVANTEVLSGGTFILSGNTSGANTNTTLVSGGTVELITAKSTLGGTLDFTGGHNELAVSATISAGFGDQAVISGFSSTDVIDLQTINSAGASLSFATSGGNTVATVSGGGVSASFIFSGTTTYTASTLALGSDSTGHAEIVYAAGASGSTTSVTTSTSSGAYTETSGNTLLVLNGGSVSAATIDNGGALVVNGGSDFAATIASGGSETMSTGSATGDAIYGTLVTVSGDAGVLTSETVENGGTLTLANANTANDTTVLSGGTFTISGADAAASGTVLSGGGVLDLASPKATVNGTLTFAGGGNTLEVTSLTTTSAGFGELAAISGFSTSDKIDVTVIASAGASLNVTSSGGNDVATITGGGGSESFVFSGTTTYTGFTLALAADANGDAELVYNPNATGLTVSNGTTSTGLTVSSGVTLNVQSGGTVINTTVEGGGTLTVSGSDQSATISAGGIETVLGSATGDQIAGNTTVDGTARNETVLAGGSLLVGGGTNVSATVSAGGSETVNDSGTTSGDQIYGTVTVNSGATVTSETVENGGLLVVSGGGTASDTTILAGGTENLSAGATGSATADGDSIYGLLETNSGQSGTLTDETVYGGGSLLLANSNNATGTTVLGGGTFTLSGKETATNTTLSGGGVLDLDSPKATLSGSLIFEGGDNTLEISAAPNLTSAGLGFHAVAAGFSSTDKIDLTSGAFTGSALTLSQTQSSGNTVVDVLSGGSIVDTFTFAGLTLSGFFELLPDGSGGVNLETPPVSVTTSVTTSTASGAYSEDATDTLLVLNGGSVTAATIDAGAFLTVNGGTDSASVISSGGLETVLAGSASGDQIYGSAAVSGGTVTGEIALSGGVLAIDASASAADTVLNGGGTVDLADPTAAITGTLTFANGGNTLLASTIADTNFGDQAVISGFSSSDKVDVTGIAPGATLAFATNADGNQVATISGTGGSESVIFSDPNTYNAGTLSLISDGSGGVDLILDTTPVVAITSLGGATNAASTIVNGTVDVAADPWTVGTTVSILDGSTAVGTATVGANGQWSATIAFTNDDGANALTATDTDAANNTGTSQSVTYNVNTTAAEFTPGDLVVSFSGDDDGSGSYADNAASPLALEEITTSGSYVAQLVLPQTTTVNNGVTEYAVSAEYGSQSEGTLELSSDGHSLVIAGYGVNADTFNDAPSSVYGTNALAQSTSVPGGQYTVVPRVIADINADGTIDTSTALLNVSNENNPRSVATVNGSSFYVSGQGVKGDTTQGVFYAVDGSSSATAINTATDTRTAEIYDGQLYVSADSTQGAENISDYGALPTSATSPTVLTGLGGSIVVTAGNANTVNAGDVGQSVSLSPENFFFANADTLYVADSGNPKEGGIGDGGLQKWVFTGSQWTLQYTLSEGLNLVPGTAAYGTSGLIGLTGEVVGNSVDLYATSYNLTDIEPTYVYAITDSLSSTTGAGESFSTIFTAAPGSNVRGIAFAPTGYAPTITGTASDQTTTSETPVAPFSRVTIADQNANAVETLTITLGGAGGALAGSGLTGGSGSYTLSGTAGTVTTELDALSFTPTAGVPNTTSTTTFTLSDQSSAYATPTTDSITSVVDTDPGVAPTISGTVAGQTTTSEAPVTPFSGVTIADSNADATDTLTITVGGSGGTLAGTGLSSGVSGVYTLSGSAGTVTSELDALSFTPNAGPPGGSATSTFTLSDQSSAYTTPTTDSTTTVIDTDPPSAPTLTSIVGQPVNGSTVEVEGTGETAGDTITLYADGGSTPVGSGLVGSGGTFDITTTTTFSAGNYTITATETDAADLTSTSSSAFDVLVASQWIGPVSRTPGRIMSGPWSTAADWNGGVPGAGDAALLDPSNTAYTVTNSADTTIASLVIAPPSGSATVAGILSVTGGTFTITGDSSNSGTVKVGSTSTTPAIDIDGTFTDTATGVLAATAGGAIDLVGGDLAGGTVSIAHGGTVAAAGGAAAPSAITGATVTDKGLLEAVGGTTLTIGTGTTINGTGGEIEATDPVAELNSEIVLGGGAINGGTLVTANGGEIDTVASAVSTLNGAGIAAGSTVTVTDGTSLILQGTIADAGTLSVASTGNTTAVEIAASGASLTGTGTVLLSDQSTNEIVAASPGATLTNTTDTISGAGVIGGGDGSLTLVNKKIIDATGENELEIDTGDTVTNSGTLEASGSSELAIDDSVANSGTIAALGGTSIVSINDVTITSTGAGTVEAGIAGAEVALRGANITGGKVVIASGAELLSGAGAAADPTITGATITDSGTLLAEAGILSLVNATVNASNGGLVQSQAEIDFSGATMTGGTLDNQATITTVAGTNSTLSGVTIADDNPITVADGSTLTLKGTITDLGGIDVASTGDATTLAIAGSITLQGGGLVSIGNGDTIASNGTAGTLIDVGDTIDGSGAIGTGDATLHLTVKAGSMIDANTESALTIDTGNTDNNAGVIEATGSGGLTIEDALTNTGTLVASGGTLIVNGKLAGAGEAEIFSGNEMAFGSTATTAVTFENNDGNTGALVLAQSAGFHGTVAGFLNDGTNSDALVLQDIASAGASWSFKENANGEQGVLTVTSDGVKATVALFGQYLAAGQSASSAGGSTLFETASDSLTNSTGTLVTTTFQQHVVAS